MCFQQNFWPASTGGIRVRKGSGIKWGRGGKLWNIWCGCAYRDIICDLSIDRESDRANIWSWEPNWSSKSSILLTLKLLGTRQKNDLPKQSQKVWEFGAVQLPVWCQASVWDPWPSCSHCSQRACWGSNNIRRQSGCHRTRKPAPTGGRTPGRYQGVPSGNRQIYWNNAG